MRRFYTAFHAHIIPNISPFAHSNRRFQRGKNVARCGNRATSTTLQTNKSKGKGVLLYMTLAIFKFCMVYQQIRQFSVDVVIRFFDFQPIQQSQFDNYL